MNTEDPAVPSLPTDAPATPVAAAAAPQGPVIATIPLDQPIPRATGDIAEVQLIRPLAAALEGHNLRALSNMDASAAMRLIPNISNPPILLHEVVLLDIADLTQMAAEISNFLLPKDWRAPSS